MRRPFRKMFGGALDAVCPPGFLCMNPPFLLGLIICLAAAVYFFTRKIDYDGSHDRKEDMRQQRQERQERQQRHRRLHLQSC
jgi:hypothetical protein